MNCYTRSIFSHCSVGTQVRVDSSLTITWSERRFNQGGPSDETAKTEFPCHSRCGTIKIPPWSKTHKEFIWENYSWSDRKIKDIQTSLLLALRLHSFKSYPSISLETNLVSYACETYVGRVWFCYGVDRDNFVQRAQNDVNFRTLYWKKINNWHILIALLFGATNWSIISIN